MRLVVLILSAAVGMALSAHPSYYPLAAAREAMEIATAVASNQTAAGASSASSTVSSTSKVANPTAITCARTYTVGRGDTCRRIAQQHGVSVDNLYSLNSGLNCNGLYYNEELCLATRIVDTSTLAATATTTAAASKCTTYVVQPNDSCWFISFIAGISLNDLESFNPGFACGNMYTGQTLCITKPEAASTPTVTNSGTFTCKTYTVARGDSCYSIVTQNGISAHDFLNYNPGIDCTNLKPGQTICLSSGAPATNKPQPGSDGSCAWHRVQSGDSCASIGRPYELNADDLEMFNKNTWRWNGCNSLLIDMKICLSQGKPPLPDINPNVECGLESAGNKTCANHRCCSKWGFCGDDDNYCLPSNGAPGTGCQSNCDMLWRQRNAKHLKANS